ncbi:NAD-dependent deacetylase [Sulfurimonas sp. NW15]|uniref:SIR2 family NAD-dependent protein deacylase n=1 Tax=Sulfurimonas sp. NW15 TaxID=2922729 RepID=UPI003DA8BE63
MAKVIIFSGAGISAESGISTFRDTGGLWEEYDIKDVCTAGCLETNRDMTIEFYNKGRVALKDKQPNKTHYEIKKLQDKYPNDIKIITQNVDDLFEKAGCQKVLHLHGFITEINCEQCGYIQDIGYKPIQSHTICPNCKNFLRPNIVFFGEPVPKYRELFKEIDDCEIFVIIGSSGNVINTDFLLSVSDVKYSILNNLEYSNAINDKLYTKVIYRKATEAIDEIVADIIKYLQNVQ